jgi:thiosulfate/3-mercaptopyruvate sulfurtransferase
MKDMRNRKKIILSLAAIFWLPGTCALSRDIAPIVSTDWLAQNLENPRLVILDIRNGERYAKGHIAGSLNTPLDQWAVSANGLMLELPSDEALRKLAGNSGIDGSSLVVVVNRTETDFSRADATRVAWTCLLSGIKNVAVLDGGFTKWVKEGRKTTTSPGVPTPKPYAGIIDRSSVATKDYVMHEIGKSVLLDARVPDEYFGITSKPGHIKSAVNLPVQWAFAPDGTLAKENVLRDIAGGVVGTNKSREIIVYCGVGGYASTWWYVLSQMLGYRNVKLYDGSMEEWIKDPHAPVTTYSWH